MRSFSLFCQFCCFLSFVNVSFMYNLNPNRLRSNSFGFFTIPTNSTLPIINNKFENKTALDNTYFAIVANCSKNNCVHGECSSDNSICLCNPNRAHISMGDNSTCSYERKKKLVAFLLEMLVPYGASSFYLGNTKYGLLKFFSLIILPIVIFTLFCNFTRPSHNSNVSKISLVGFIMFWSTFFIGILIWLVLDLLAITFNEVTDGNNIALEDW